MAKTQTASKPVQVAAAVSYVAMIAINALANTLPINGRTTGGVSDAYQNLFAPAGLTFAVWGVIYLLLGAHVLYQLGLFHDDSRQTSGRAALLQRVGVLFSLTWSTFPGSSPGITTRSCSPRCCWSGCWCC